MKFISLGRALQLCLYPASLCGYNLWATPPEPGTGAVACFSKSDILRAGLCWGSNLWSSHLATQCGASVLWVSWSGTVETPLFLVVAFVEDPLSYSLYGAKWKKECWVEEESSQPLSHTYLEHRADGREDEKCCMPALPLTLDWSLGGEEALPS